MRSSGKRSRSVLCPNCRLAPGNDRLDLSGGLSTEFVGQSARCSSCSSTNRSVPCAIHILVNADPVQCPHICGGLGVWLPTKLVSLQRQDIREEPKSTRPASAQ